MTGRGGRRHRFFWLGRTALARGAREQGCTLLVSVRLDYGDDSYWGNMKQPTPSKHGVEDGVENLVVCCLRIPRQSDPPGPEVSCRNSLGRCVARLLLTDGGRRSIDDTC